ncbi:MAG: DUF6691 family protein [Caldilineaceae bacterium]
MQKVIAILAGIIFGLGLSISQMIDRGRVLGFLDAAGTWDPTLIFVLGGAVGVTVITFRFILPRSKPLFAPKFYLPTSFHIDRDLILGSALFGVGWGISGYCPGPAIASLALGSGNALIFMGALIVGSYLAGKVPAPSQPTAVSSTGAKPSTASSS